MTRGCSSSLATEEDATKTLISALSFLSRNLPLPPHLFSAVSSIYDADDDALHPNGGDFMADLEDALGKQRLYHMTSSELAEARQNRMESHIQSRLTQLEELPASRGEDLQSKCLIELYGLKVDSNLEVLAFSSFLLYLTIISMMAMAGSW